MNKLLALGILALLVFGAVTVAFAPKVSAFDPQHVPMLNCDEENRGWDAWNQIGPYVGGEALWCARHGFK